MAGSGSESDENNSGFCRNVSALSDSPPVMIQRLDLFEFKNFERATLDLGPFTVLVGANASGKSNIRDAFRFLHGLSRGYTLAETVGEKWIEGGVLQWQGIRGGIREAPHFGNPWFGLSSAIETSYSVDPVGYGITVESNGGQPRIGSDTLFVPDDERPFFSTLRDDGTGFGHDAHHVSAQVRQRGRRGADPVKQFLSDRPLLTQVLDRDDIERPVKRAAEAVIAEFASMRFLDLSPDAMRRPSTPGQLILSDRGENLASVLQALYSDDDRRGILLDWIRELTPMDVQDLDFSTDPRGQILLNLVDASGHPTSVYSASDGTLRLLALLAAFLGPEPARFYFLEELEVGIHPARLHLLLDLIEQQTRPQPGRRPIQVVATTHSPHLLRLLQPSTLADAALVYRPEGRSDAQIVKLLDVPGAPEQTDAFDAGRLLEERWFEAALDFAGDGSTDTAPSPISP